MPRQDYDKVTFQDVAACFSEEEWKLLHEWQKELYRNVMKEIHQALVSLGPLIAASVFSLSAKEKDFSSIDRKKPERRYSIDHSSIDHSPSDTMSRPDENEYSKSPPDARKERNVSIGSGIPFLHFDNCLGKKEQLSASLRDNCATESVVNLIGHNLEELPLINTDFCMRNEDHSAPRVPSHPRTGRGKGSTDTASDDLPITIKEEEDNCSTDHQECVIVESISSPKGDGRTSRHNMVEEIVQCTNNKPLCKPSSGEGNAHSPHSIYKGTDFASQNWPENYWEPTEQKSVCYERGFANSEPANLHPPSRLGVPQNYNECESELRSVPFINQQPSTNQGLIPYKCSECDEIYSLKGELIRHMKAHSGVKPYACTYCEKSFFRKANLIAHYSTHTGEKPFMCTFCHKRFNRKYNLNGHIRIHTGERPYKCSECEKSFIWKGDLNQHRRKHT